MDVEGEEDWIHLEAAPPFSSPSHITWHVQKVTFFMHPHSNLYVYDSHKREMEERVSHPPQSCLSPFRLK